MGIFGKLKQNFNHGGVKVSLQAPASVSISSGLIPVTVTVQATDSPATVKSVTVELVRQALQQSTFGANSNQNTNTSVQTISQVQSNEAFNLAPNESKIISLSLAMNAGKAVEEALGNTTAGKIAHGFGMLETAVNQISQTNYNYSFEANADVDGIAIDPGDSQPVQVLKAGEIGTAANFKIKL